MHYAGKELFSCHIALRCATTGCMNSVTNKQPRNVRLDERTILRLKTIANSHGISASDLVRNALLEKLPIWESRGVTLSRVDVYEAKAS